MQDHVSVFVLTSSYDLNCARPLFGITENCWTRFSDNTQVYYLSRDHEHWRQMRDIIDSVRPTCIYLNSMFSRVYTIIPLLLYYFGVIGKPRLCLAPRGMLQPEAMAQKKLIKKAFISLMRLSGLAGKVHFQSTSEEETRNIERNLKIPKERIIEIANIGVPVKIHCLPIKKIPKHLSLVYISRISAHKNLMAILKCLQVLDPALCINLDIYGPIESATYWRRCKKLMGKIMKNCVIRYAGELEMHEVPETILRYHALILLSQSENFGHIIYESMSVGRPVIISNKTPWRDIGKAGAGWSIPLDDYHGHLQAITEAALLDQETYLTMCEAAHSYACNRGNREENLKLYLEFFDL